MMMSGDARPSRSFPRKRKASSITNEAFELATEILRLIHGPNHRFAWQYALQYRTSNEQEDDEARSAHQDEKNAHAIQLTQGAARDSTVTVTGDAAVTATPMRRGGPAGGSPPPLPYVEPFGVFFCLCSTLHYFAFTGHSR